MKNKKRRILSILLAAVMALSISAPSMAAPAYVSNGAELGLYDLTVEYVEAPQGIDVAPRFGWKMDSNVIGTVQTAYQIVIEDSKGALAWNSGVQASDASIAVKCAENVLIPETDYVWTVTIWDNFDRVASATSTFSTGIAIGRPTNGGDWEGAKWISVGSTNYQLAYLRTESALKNKPVASAKLYMTAMGNYRAFINGELVLHDGLEAAFDPGWTDYRDYVFYQTFDVTGYIKSSQLAIGVELGRGWYKSTISGGSTYNNVLSGGESNRDLALLGKLVVKYTDGDKSVIITDESWKKNTDGPIYNNDFYSNGSFNPAAAANQYWMTDPATWNTADGVTWGGEKYDARKEMPGWTLPGFTQGASWGDVRIVTYPPRVESCNASNTAYFNTKLDFDPIHDYVFDSYTPVPTDQLETFMDGTTQRIRNVDPADPRYVYGTVNKTSVDALTNGGSVTIQPGERLVVDLGQNISGVVEAVMSADPDTIVTFSHVEMLNDGKCGETFPPATSDANPGNGSISTVANTNKYGGAAAGAIYAANLRGEKTAVYVFGNNANVTYRPSHTFFGFQFVQITASKPLTVSKVVGKPITSAMKQTGFIETNIPGLNKLFSNVRWSQMDNFLSIPTDCPQRNERNGWTGDVQLFTGTAIYNYDVSAFLQNYAVICDTHLNRNPNKLYGPVMPVGSYGGNGANSGWSDVGVCLPYMLWQQSGDPSIIETSYESMDLYMTTLKTGTNASNYNLQYATGNYGDWVALNACSVTCLNLIYYAYDALLMSEMAAATGRAAEVAKYENIFEDAKAFFIEKYYTVPNNAAAGTSITTEGIPPGTKVDDLLSATADNSRHLVAGGNNGGVGADNSQTAISWALKLGFYRDEAHRQYLVSKLLESIKNAPGALPADFPHPAAQAPAGSDLTKIRPRYEEDTLAVGFLGLNVILPSLSAAGQTEYAYKLLQTDNFPSWLYSVKSGATSIWERWNSYSLENGFLATSMNSFNHFSFGACIEWMYREVAGIEKDKLNPGFKHSILQPTMDATLGIDDVKGSYDSYYGEITSDWTSSGGKLATYSAVVPANTTSTLYLPVGEAELEGFNQIPGLTYLGMEEHNGQECAKFNLLSGGYNFDVTASGLIASFGAGYVAPVQADINSPATVTVNTPASYTVSLEYAMGVGVVTLGFTADSRYLDLPSATALGGFSILEPLTWEYIGSQMWKGAVKLYNPGFVQSNAPLDVLEISGSTLGLIGDTTVTLTDFEVTGDVNGFADFLPCEIRKAEAATSIGQKYSKYDLNHDGRIDELDLAIVVYYYLANDLEADWAVVKFDIASAKDCDVAINGRVDLADMIEVIANYADSY
ncbi:MAG: family 78 glycoside hydrolase catalytic domain [Oscillospiraceae bacterium]|nr:family 78 glycoside hydrolase catalytic domain [Oscillospiraceae bacterium]